MEHSLKLSLFLTLKLKLMIVILKHVYIESQLTLILYHQMEVWFNLCLLTCAKRICLFNFSFDNKVKLLKSVFLNNDYRNWFFDKVLNSFYFQIGNQPIHYGTL